jgi:ribose 5-phosphate isomerase B
MNNLGKKHYFLDFLKTMINRRDFLRQSPMLVAGSVVSANFAASCHADSSNAASPSNSNSVSTDDAIIPTELKGMKVVIGSDHAGYALKAKVLGDLHKLGLVITDLGCHDETPVDFPDIAQKLCAMILSGEALRGIMFCGTGVGASIACNKIPGIRASVCHDIYSSHQCVEHDDVQVMAVGAQVVGHSVVLEYIQSFLRATFSTEEQFRRRVEKLKLMDTQRIQ